MESPLPSVLTDVTLSRRQVVQTAVWAAPAIVIAAQPPALGASQEATSIVVAGASALRAGDNQQVRIIQAQATVAQASGTSHVRNATLRFEFVSSLVSSTQTPTILSGAGWALLSKGTAAGVSYFEYQAAGDVNTSTAPLSIRVTTTSTSNFTSSVTFRATAQPPLTSTVPVPPVSTSVSVGVVSTLTVDGQLNSFMSGNRLVLQRGQFRWDGPYVAGAPSISGLQSTVTIPKTLVSSLTVAGVQITQGAAAWTVQSVTDTGSAFVVLFTSALTLTQSASAAGQLEISVPRRTPRQAGTVTWAGTGVCAGVTIPATFSSPSSLAVPAN